MKVHGTILRACCHGAARDFHDSAGKLDLVAGYRLNCFAAYVAWIHDVEANQEEACVKERVLRLLFGVQCECHTRRT